MSQFDVVLQELQAIRDERRTHANTATRVGTAMIDMLGLLGNLDFLPLTGGAMKNSNLVTNLNADLLDGHHAAYFATASAMETLGGTVAGHTSAISTLESYFTGGVANRALRLDDDDPCTAWGQRFWQDGVPQSISGTLDGVENIIMSGVINIGGFVIEKTADGLKFNGNIYATGGVAALGATGASGGGGSAQYLRDLLDVNVSSMSDGQVLTYRNGYWTAEAAQTPSLTAYATKTWVQQQGYLTQHQSLAAYATQQWVNERGFAYGADLSYLANYVQQTYVEKVNGKGLSTNDFTNTLLSKLNGIQAGANYYEHPTGGANTTITAASGKVLSAITVDNLGHVTSVGSKTLAPADIPALGASKITSGTFDVARIPNLDASKITSGTLDTARIPDLSSIYLLKVAGESYPITNSLYIGSVTGRGVFVKDPAGNYVPAFYQNGENLWIGSTQTLDTHHRGQTYISAGYDGTHGNKTIYVCVPNDSNNGGTNYGVWHSGNDGAGSGLDADLLDGHDSSYFATTSALTTLAGTVSAQGGRITTLEGYFDNGVANSAKRLNGSDTCYVWGQEFWEDGAPKGNVNGDIAVDEHYSITFWVDSYIHADDDDWLHLHGNNGIVLDGITSIDGFAIENDSGRLRLAGNVYATGALSCLGTSATGSSGGALSLLTDVSISATPADGTVLTYDSALAKWTPKPTQAAGLSAYATKSWVEQNWKIKRMIASSVDPPDDGRTYKVVCNNLSLSNDGTIGVSYVLVKDTFLKADITDFAHTHRSSDIYDLDLSDYALSTDVSQLRSDVGSVVTGIGVDGDTIYCTYNDVDPHSAVAYVPVTVPFATDSKVLRNFFGSRPASANNQYGDGKLRHYMATSSMTTGKPPVDAHIIHSAWDNTGGYDAQLAIGNSNSGLFFRTQSQGTWQAWKQVAIIDNLDTLGDNLQNYVTTQLGGYLPLTAGSSKPLTDSLYIENNKGLYIKDTNGTGQMAVSVNRINEFFVGSGMRDAGYTGYFDSYVMKLRSGASGTTMTLDASNNVGIGTTTPSYKLDVNGVIRATEGIMVRSGQADAAGLDATGIMFMKNGHVYSVATFQWDSGNSVANMAFTNNVGFGITSPQHRIHADGNIVATGAVAALGTSAQGSGGTALFSTLMCDTLECGIDIVLGAHSHIYFEGTTDEDPAIYIQNGHLYARAGGGNTVQLV